MTSQSPQAPNFPPWPQFGEAERTGLLRTLEQGQWWRTGGQEVDSFEREFGEYHGTPYALAVTNGTHALELALEVLGIGPGAVRALVHRARLFVRKRLSDRWAGSC